jgi:glycosyltransferase involved in cell wall biosynthesis
MAKTLGYFTPVRAYSIDGEIYMQSASGRTAEALAEQFEKVYMCARVVHVAPPEPFDLPLHAPNLELIEQPYWNSTAGSLLHFWGITRAYVRTCARADALFVRGLCPYIAVLYLCAWIFQKPICHWIVGDSVALLRSGSRKGRATDFLSLLFALLDRWFTRAGRWIAGGALVCNGHELARAYASPRTTEIVSSTIRDREFFSRADTCRQPVIRILFVGFVRPEKGIEYLLGAVAELNSSIRWRLEIVGPREYPDYCKKLGEIVAAHDISRKIRWTDYVPNGAPLFNLMRTSDVFVLPTLSEGTPHVLVEARANGLPCISTWVGGVPDTVTHGYDALLVPPKDSERLARAIEQVIFDGELRRMLIRNGLLQARSQTLDQFIATVLKELNPDLSMHNAPVPQD